VKLHVLLMCRACSSYARTQVEGRECDGYAHAHDENVLIWFRCHLIPVAEPEP
jgi:hypothetical protein